MSVWLILFVLGVLILVRVMVVGVSRTPKSVKEGRAAKKLNTPLLMLGAFCAVAGLAGHIANRLNVGDVWALAFAFGPAAVAVVSVRAAALRSSAIEGIGAAAALPFQFQGNLAHVIESIEPGVLGRITFQGESGPCQVRAKAVDEVAIAAGVEVVIERIDGDVATVEPWSRVEQRL